MYYIGLDVGTSGCKASIIDGNGEIHGYASQRYNTISPEHGYVEIDAREVWNAVRMTLSDVAGKSIVALAVASFGEAVVLVGKNGEVLSNSIYFSDIRGTEETKYIVDTIDASKITAITGMPPNSIFSANKLLWIKKNQPDLFNEAEYYMLFGDFISYMLTGERAIDYSLASRTMLFDIGNNCWASDVIMELGLPENKLSTPVRAGTIIGNILPSVASELGLPETLKVVAGGHDQALAALGSGAILPGDSVIGMGSSECITAVLAKEDINARMAEYNFCCEPHLIENSFITLAFNASAGTAMNWFKDKLYDDLVKKAEAAGENVYRLMDASCPENPTDLMFLPYVGGAGTPYFDAAIGGSFIGLTLATGREDMYRAVLEGICFELRLNLELLERCGIAPDKLQIVGGGTQSQLLLQIKADVLGRRIETLKDRETGTIALGLLCAKAMGEIDDFTAVAKAGADVSAVYEPDPERAEFYSKKMEKYRKLYGAIKSLE